MPSGKPGHDNGMDEMQRRADETLTRPSPPGSQAYYEQEIAMLRAMVTQTAELHAAAEQDAERLRAANGLLLDAVEFYAYTGKDDGGKLARSTLAQEAVVDLTTFEQSEEKS